MLEEVEWSRSGLGHEGTRREGGWANLALDRRRVVAILDANTEAEVLRRDVAHPFLCGKKKSEKGRESTEDRWKRRYKSTRTVEDVLARDVAGDVSPDRVALAGR